MNHLSYFDKIISPNILAHINTDNELLIRRIWDDVRLSVLKSVIAYKVKPIEWSEELEANGRDSNYNHVKGTCPIGTFIITWKGWKDYPSYDVESSVADIHISGNSLEEVKKLCEEYYASKVLDCLL